MGRRIRGRKPYSGALGLVLAGVLLACPRTFALDPALDISQYAHTAWKVREGFTKGTIVSIAQTPDGYLWLGTEFGLLRFDGVRSVPWQPPSGRPFAKYCLHACACFPSVETSSHSGVMFFFCLRTATLPKRSHIPRDLQSEVCDCHRRNSS